MTRAPGGKNRDRQDRLVAMLLTAVLVWAMANIGCQSGNKMSGSVRRPNVVLVVADTLRWDRLSCYGHRQRSTPHLDRLSREGVLFENAYSTAPWTLPAHGSLYTGLLPRDHGSHWEHYPLSESTKTLPQLLQEAGYRTAGRSANPWLNEANGYARGFDSYEVAFAGKRHVEETGDKGARAAVDWAMGWIEETAGDGDQPFFLFLNLMEPHLPFIPPEEFDGHFAPRAAPEKEHHLKEATLHHLYLTGQVKLDGEDFRVISGRYDGLVAYTDFQLGRLAAHLRSLDLLQSTLIVFLSDHGENLGEHELMGHQFCLYDTLLKIPLLLRGPLPLTAGTLNSRPVQISDVLPLVLDLCDLSSPEGGERGAAKRLIGKSGDDSESGGDLPLSAEYHLPDRGPLARMKKEFPDFPIERYHRRLYSFRLGDWKIISCPRGGQELYNLGNDPRELVDLSRARPLIRARLLEELRRRYPEALPREPVQNRPAGKSQF